MYVPRSDVRPYAGMIRQGGQALMSTLVLIDWYIDSRSQNHAKEHKLRQGVLLIVSFGLLLCFTLPPVLTLWRDTQGERVTDAKVTKAIFGEFDNLKASNSLLLSQHKTDSSALIKAKDELLMSQKRHTAAILSNQEILVSSRKIMKRQLILTQKIDSILTPVSKRIRRIIKK